MDKEVLKKLLKENLTINIKEEKDIGGHYLIVSIEFDGEEICDELINIGNL